MKYETVKDALKANLNGSIYITRSVEAPCGPCYLGADHEVFAVYSTEAEALDEVESIFKEHRCDSENYIMEVVKADVDADGEFDIDYEPIRELPDDRYWEEHGDEFNYDRECWAEMPDDDEDDE